MTHLFFAIDARIGGTQRIIDSVERVQSWADGLTAKFIETLVIYDILLL
jgi:hypothetical protein